RYADYQNCSASYGCSGSINSEYLDGTYVFTVDVPPSAAGQDIDIQAYDPEYADGNTGGQPCGNQWLSGAQLTSLTATYPDSAVRYAGGATDWCPGDDDTNLGTPQATAWIVRDSSVSQFQALANPVVGTGGPGGSSSPCAHQFKGYVPNSATYWFDLLQPGTANYDADFATAFHRYYTVCHISAAVPGKYFVQVRSNVPQGSDTQRDDANYLTSSQTPPSNPGIG